MTEKAVGTAPVALARTNPGFLPSLDGLRAVSVAAVLAYHLGRLDGGFLGVDVFFVISGFLITRLLLAERERTGGVSLVVFWGRRFRRLLPALLVVLVAVAVSSRLALPGWRLGGIRDDALSALAYVANWRFIASGQSYFAQGVGPSPLRHTWSLGIEEQFYLFWPLVVVGIAALSGKRHRLAVLVVAGVGALASGVWMAVAAGQGDLARVYYGTDTRLFALLGGAWLAAWWDPIVADGPRRATGRPRAISRLGPLALVPLLVAFVVGVDDQAWFYRGGFQLVTVLTVAAIAGLAAEEGKVAEWLGSPVPRWVGRRSYGIYLWSWPIQVLAVERLNLGGIALDAVVVALSVVLAALSFELIEEPIRTQRWSLLVSHPRGRRAKPAPVRVPVLARSVLAVGAVAAVIAASSAGAPSAPKYLSVTDDEAVSAALKADSGFGPADEGRARTAALVTVTTLPSETTSTTEAIPTTAPGNPGPFDWRASIMVAPDAQVDPQAVHDRPLRVMVAGDSVGWSLGWELESGLTSSVRVSDRAIIGCGLMPGDAKWIVGASEAQEYAEPCDHQAEAESLGLADEPDVALLWVGAWEVYDHVYQGERYRVGSDEFGELLELRLQAEIDKFRDRGVPTVMPVVPCFGTNAPRLGRERYDLERITWLNERLKTVALRNRGWVRIIDPTGQLCIGPEQSRDANLDGLPIRVDGVHFDTESATWFWNSWLAGQMGAAFAPVATPGAD